MAYMYYVKPVTCHLSLRETATATIHFPGNSPSMHMGFPIGKVIQKGISTCYAVLELEDFVSFFLVH